MALLYLQMEQTVQTEALEAEQEGMIGIHLPEQALEYLHTLFWTLHTFPINHIAPEAEAVLHSLEQAPNGAVELAAQMEATEETMLTQLPGTEAMAVSMVGDREDGKVLMDMMDIITVLEAVEVDSMVHLMSMEPAEQAIKVSFMPASHWIRKQHRRNYEIRSCNG